MIQQLESLLPWALLEAGGQLGLQLLIGIVEGTGAESADHLER